MQLLLALIMVSATPAASVRGKSTYAFEERSVRGFRRHAASATSGRRRDRSFIVDYSTSPPAELKVEITYAVAEKEYLRMEYFLEHGYVNAAGKVSSSGTKNTGHKIHVEDEFYSPTNLLEQACSRIQSAVARKSIKPNAPQKYGRGHVLLVAFNEWYVVHSVQDMAVIKDFVEKHVLTLPLNFAALYIVGLHGETVRVHRG